jgi:hypothetical protein
MKETAQPDHDSCSTCNGRRVGREVSLVDLEPSPWLSIELVVHMALTEYSVVNGVPYNCGIESEGGHEFAQKKIQMVKCPEYVLVTFNKNEGSGIGSTRQRSHFIAKDPKIAF